MAKPKGIKAIDEQWVNRKDMARILGISGVQLDNYRKMDTNQIPHDSLQSPTKYPVTASVRWFTEYQVRLSDKRQGRGTRKESEDRLKDAQARLAELQVAREEEITVTRDEAGSRMNRVCEAFVAGLGGIPGRHAHEFVALPDEVHAQVALKQMTDKVRAELCEVYGIEETEE